MSLPESWVDRIFAKLTLVYGHQFLSRWDGLSIADVKADWAHELDGYQNNPQAIAFALSNLPPSRAPNVLEFRELCFRAPRSLERALPPPSEHITDEAQAKGREEARKLLARLKAGQL